jgi:hypothetical protein
MLLERRAGVTDARLCRDATGLGPAPDPADRCRGADIEQSAASRALSPSWTIPTTRSLRSFEYPHAIEFPPKLPEGPESDLHPCGNPLLLFRFTSSRKGSSLNTHNRIWIVCQGTKPCTAPHRREVCFCVIPSSPGAWPSSSWSSGTRAASRLVQSRVRPGPHQESEEPKGICVLLRVGDPVGDGTRCEIWTKRFRPVHAKELGKP